MRVIQKLTSKIEDNIRLYLPKELYDLLFKELSRLQRDEIDWYDLELAIKDSQKGLIQEMHLKIAIFHRQQIQRFGIKSIYHESKKKILLISFSGGRTSAFMTYWIMSSNKYKDYKKVVVFANTGKEREETLIFVNECDMAWGLDVVWIEYDPKKEHGKKNWFKVVDFITASRKGEPFERFISKERIPNAAYPNCSGRLKSLPIRNYMKDLGYNNYETAIGIRADEPQMINWDSANKNKLIYPLVTDFRVSENYIRRFWSEMPFDLNLLDYEGNCDMCWKKSKRKLMTLIVENPKLIEWWSEMEDKYGNDSFTFWRKNEKTKNLIDESNKKEFIMVVDKLELSKNAPDLFSQELDVEASCFCK